MDENYKFYTSVMNKAANAAREVDALAASLRAREVDRTIAQDDAPAYVAKARHDSAHRWTDWADADADDDDDGTNPPGFGGLGDDVPDLGELPRRGPVPASGLGASELAGESRVTRGDGTTQAYARLGRELAGLRTAVRQARNEIQDILDEEPEPADTNQRQWPGDGIGDADLLTGKAYQHGTVSDLMGALGHTGQPMQRSLMAKSLSILQARIDAAADADALDLNEQLACSTLLAMIPAANAMPQVHQDFMDRLDKSTEPVKRIFGV